MKKLIVFILTLSLIAAIGVSAVSAATVTPYVIDQNRTCSVTVHKYIMDRHITYQKEYLAGHELTADELKGITDAPVNGKALGGIKFAAYPLDGSGQKITKTDALINSYKTAYGKYTKIDGKTKYTADEITAILAKFKTDSSGFVYIESNATDTNGITTFSDLFQGTWYIEELENSRVASKAVPMTIVLPFAASSTDWQYDAHVYPKNTDISVVKDIQHLGNDHHTARIGEQHTWIVTSTLPDDLSEYNKYQLTDVINSKLDYVGITKLCAVSGSTTDTAQGTETTLTLNTDYTVTAPTSSNGNKLTVALTDTGRKKTDPDEGSIKSTKLRLYFVTKISDKITETDLGKEIPNQAKVEFTNSFFEDKERTSDIPEVHTAGVKVYKYDSETKKALAGATFKIATSLENAKNGVFMKTADGKSDYELTTGKDGYILFTGLTFGKQASLQGSATAIDGQKIADSSTEYYLVETKAPVDTDTGITYQLCSAPIKVTANSTSHLQANAVQVENKKVTVKTGGTGTLAFDIIGILVAGAAATGLTYTLTRKKKQK